MSTLSYIGILGGIFSLAGYIPYAKAVIRGEAKPERSSWLIWTLSSMLILMSYYLVGARETIWVPLAYVVGSATITLLSFRYGQEGWGLLEKVSLGVAIISGIRWVFFNNVGLALILNLSLSFISYLRTIKKLAFDRTAQEDLPGWIFYFIGAALNLMAISVWSVEISALPIMFFVMNGVTLLLTLRNRKYAPQENPVS
jgi:hypothetical protein